jgi:hypothetical protein
MTETSWARAAVCPRGRGGATGDGGRTGRFRPQAPLSGQRQRGGKGRTAENLEQ